MIKDCINPLDYQNKLLKEVEKDNLVAIDRIIFLASQYIYPWQTGTVVGPYCTFTDYFMTNGELLTVISPSSLIWVQPLNLDY